MQINFELHPAGHGYRAVVPCKSGKFELSIIAGELFYSSPQENLKSADEYTEVELAIFDATTHNWATKQQMKDGGVFDIIGEGEHEYNDIMDKPSNGVWGWVSLADIEKLIETC